MNTDHQDIKSCRKPNLCENLCPKFISSWFPDKALLFTAFQNIT